MLKIEVSKGKGHIEQKGKISEVMADMFMAIHAFYNTLDEDDKRIFKKSFDNCRDDIMSDIDESEDNESDDNESEDDKIEDIDGLLKTLRELKGILEELKEEE